MGVPPTAARVGCSSSTSCGSTPPAWSASTGASRTCWRSCNSSASCPPALRRSSHRRRNPQQSSSGRSCRCPRADTVHTHTPDAVGLASLIQRRKMPAGRAGAQPGGSPVLGGDALRAFQVGKARTSWKAGRGVNTAVSTSLGPAELAGVPLDEGFGFMMNRSSSKPGLLLADLGVAALDDQPVPLAADATGEVETDDDAPPGEAPRRIALHIDHRATKGSRCSGAISSQWAPHSPSDMHTANRS